MAMDSEGVAAIAANLAVGQRLLELLHAFVRDLGAVEVQPLEASQSFKLLESRVRNWRVAEVQLLKLA
jgi:hypothetical protein